MDFPIVGVITYVSKGNHTFYARVTVNGQARNAVGWPKGHYKLTDGEWVRARRIPRRGEEILIASLEVAEGKPNPMISAWTVQEEEKREKKPIQLSGYTARIVGGDAPFGGEVMSGTLTGDLLEIHVREGTVGTTKHLTFPLTTQNAVRAGVKNDRSIVVVTNSDDPADPVHIVLTPPETASR